MTDERKPVIPRLFVSMAFAAGFEPRQIRLVKTFDSVPVKKRPRIKKDDQRDAGPNHDCKIFIIPRWFYRARIVEPVEIICYVTNSGRDRGAGDMEYVGF